MAICVFLPFGPIAADESSDQQRGIYLLAEVAVEDAQATFLDNLWPQIRDALAAERDTVGFISREQGPAGELQVRITEQQGVQRAKEIISELTSPATLPNGDAGSNIDVRIDNLLLTITLSKAGVSALNERTMVQTVQIIRNRIDQVGSGETTVLRKGSDRIILRLFGVDPSNDVVQLVATSAKLSFNAVIDRSYDAQETVAAGQMLLPSENDNGTFYILDRRPVVTGDELEDVRVEFDQIGLPAIGFRFNAKAARTFGDYTAQNIGNPFAIILDNEVISAPTIQSHIPGGQGIITGNFTMEEASNLVTALRAGALPARLNILEERIIGPTVSGEKDK